MYISVAFVKYLWDTPPASDENHCVVGVQMLSDIELAIKKKIVLLPLGIEPRIYFPVSTRTMELQLGVNVYLVYVLD